MSDDLIRRVECEKCHKNFSIPKNQRGDFSHDVYKLRNGFVIPLFKHRGFCWRCDDFVWLEKLLSTDEIKNEIASLNEKIKRYINGDESIGSPTYDYFRSVVGLETTWIDFMASRDKPLCLSCGRDGVVLVSDKQIDLLTGDLSIQHPRCGGQIIGSFYKFDGAPAMINWRRYDPKAPLEFNEYSSRGHKKDSFYYNLFRIMEAEVCALKGFSSASEITVVNKDHEVYFNWVRAFVRSELGGESLNKASFSIYADLPWFMETFEPIVRQEMLKFEEELRVNSSKSTKGEKFWKWFWGA